MVTLRSNNMAWDDNLEGPFRRIASYDGPFLRVLAGPGTGKTFSLMRRISRILEEGVDPKRILLLTFTRVSAGDLVRKVTELGIDSAEHVRATTLHSFCFSMLQREEVIRATGRIPRPMLEFELEPLYHDLKHQNLGVIRQLRKDVKAFESAWARLQREEPGWALTSHDRAIEDTVLSWLRFHESMLIGELVPISLQYVRDNPGTPFREMFDHVIVDEYQDLNRAEQVLLDLLSENAALTIAGDDDQSIYSFKYAHPEGITEFNEAHPGTHDEQLIECKRCPRSVVGLARELILRNQRYPKQIKEGDDSIPGRVIPIQWRGMRREAKGIAGIVHHYIADIGTPPGEVLVLAQRRNIAGMISEELERRGLEVVNYYNQDVLDNQVAQERFTLLCLSADQEDRTALRNWLAFGATTRRVGPYSRLRLISETQGVSPWEALNRLLDGNLMIPHSQSLVERFRVLRGELNRTSGTKGSALVDVCFPEDVNECSRVRQMALDIVTEEMAPRDLAVLLRVEIAQPQVPLERKDIGVMSLHKAKGLEAELVVIPGCVEGLIPRVDEDAPPIEQQRQLEENRRLFYVGMTRTRNTLVLSSFLYMRRGDAVSMGFQYHGSSNIVRLVTSRFVTELGSSLPRPQSGERFLRSLPGS